MALLHYSGHGSHVPDDNRDESDGRDEILCPTDLDWDDPLRDDWLRSTFDGLRAGVNLTVIMDCCHSGTNTRAVLPPDAPVKQRYLPSPWGLAVVESGRSLPKKVSSELRRSPRAARKGKDIVPASVPEMLITGCRDTQTSADAFINGRYNGALTFALVVSRGAFNPIVPFVVLILLSSLTSAFYAQLPITSGSNMSVSDVVDIACLLLRAGKSMSTRMDGNGCSDASAT